MGGEVEGARATIAKPPKIFLGGDDMPLVESYKKFAKASAKPMTSLVDKDDMEKKDKKKAKKAHKGLIERED